MNGRTLLMRFVDMAAEGFEGGAEDKQDSSGHREMDGERRGVSRG